MSIKDFRSNLLSDRIVSALIETIQAYSSMDVLLNEYPAIKPVLCDMLLSLNIYYGLYNTQPNLNDICLSLYIPNQENTAGKSAEIIRACTEYAQNKVHTMDVLTAGDVLKIDGAIKNANIKHLSMSEHDEQRGKIEAVWSILHDLYGPRRQYPLLLETAIACYRLLTFSGIYHFNLQSLTILFSILYQNTLSFQGLPRQWIVSTDPRLTIESMNIEDALIHVLSVFQQMWLYTVTLIRKLNDKKDEISKLINSTYPQLASSDFCRLLSENICIRNQNVSEGLHISKKTVIKHLKQLEENNILFSIKNGREIFYFNNILLDLLTQSTEVSNNGAEKP